MATMARYSSLRASDADRDSAVQRLRQAAVEGRLESYELEERVDAALRARTYGELDRLLADLPQPPTRRPRPTPASVAVPVPAARIAFGLAVRVVIGLALVALVLSAAALFAAWWLIWIFIWLAFRASHGRCSGAPRGRPPYHSVSRLT